MLVSSNLGRLAIVEIWPLQHCTSPFTTLWRIWAPCQTAFLSISVGFWPFCNLVFLMHRTISSADTKLWRRGNLTPHRAIINVWIWLNIYDSKIELYAIFCNWEHLALLDFNWFPFNPTIFCRITFYSWHSLEELKIFPILANLDPDPLFHIMDSGSRSV